MTVENNVPEAVVETSAPAVEDTPTQDSTVQGEAPVVQEEPVKDVAPDPYERKIHKSLQELMQKEKELRALKQEIDPAKGELEVLGELKKDPKANAIKILKHFGADPSDILDALLGDELKEPEPELSPLELRLKELENKLSAKEKAELEQQELQKAAQEKQQQEAAQKTVEEFKASIKEVVGASKDKYEFISSLESYDMVFDVVTEYFSETGTIIPLDKALEKVESYLESQALAFLKTDKLKQKLGAGLKEGSPKVSKADVSTPEVKVSTPQPKAKTLRTTILGSAEPIKVKVSHKFTEQENVDKAIQKLSALTGWK